METIKGLLNNIIQELGKSETLFCSEAHFQHVLAMKLAEMKNKNSIFPEFPIVVEDGSKRKEIYVDLVLKHEGKYVPIELKYKTKKATIKIDDRDVELKSHSAQDVSRYDFIKDISRIEKLISDPENKMDIGYAIFLTNEKNYWENPSNGWKNCCDAMFRIHEKQRISGEMKWGKSASPGTTKGRPDFNLKWQYKMKWSDYTTEDSQQKNRYFRFLIIEIKKPAPCSSQK